MYHLAFVWLGVREKGKRSGTAGESNNEKFKNVPVGNLMAWCEGEKGIGGPAGESYAGIYVPTLAKAVLAGNDAQQLPHINLKVGLHFHLPLRPLSAPLSRAGLYRISLT
jgi:Serine carboxypeptidase